MVSLSRSPLNSKPAPLHIDNLFSATENRVSNNVSMPLLADFTLFSLFFFSSNFLLGLILCVAFLYRLIRHCSRQAWNRVPPATNCCLLLTYKGSIDTS